MSKSPCGLKTQKTALKKSILEFYHHLYPMEEDPLFWIDLNVDYPFHLKGILYFPENKRASRLAKAHRPALLQ